MEQVLQFFFIFIPDIREVNYITVLLFYFLLFYIHLYYKCLSIVYYNVICFRSKYSWRVYIGNLSSLFHKKKNKQIYILYL